MSKERNKNVVIIGLLVGIIVAVIVLVILLATGTINFNNYSPNENNKENINGTTNNSTKEVDSVILNNLYTIVGIIPVDQYSIHSCLNISVSDNNYKENAKSIFSWYALLHDMDTYHYNDDKCQASEQCKKAYSAAASSSILKNNAHKIIKQYHFDNELNGYLTDMPAYEDEYYYASATTHPSICDYDVTNDPTSQYINSSDIRITDNQTIIEYEIGSDHTIANIKNTKHQTVTYDFKKDSEGNYYLYQVNVQQ